jgi:hypothetical protein
MKREGCRAGMKREAGRAGMKREGGQGRDEEGVRAGRAVALGVADITP